MSGPDTPRTTLPGQVSLTIDGVLTTVPKGTLVIRAAEDLGIQIPRFCDHPLLDPVGACRQCLVEVEGQRKPLASCTTVATEGMVVRTQHTSPVADKAQHGVMEMLLINHPLDCPMCDKGGECPLQNQAMSNGRTQTRFEDVKRTFPKPIPLSSEILLDRERCVLCARCTRFADQIAGDPSLAMLERGATQQVGVHEGEAFDSYFSGNTVQICPVGALTNVDYRFRARPFDLVSTPSICEHCASGCAGRTDHRRGTVLRRLAGDDPAVNEEWNCDKGRWAFAYANAHDRLRSPLVRDETGALAPASWPEALAVAARGLQHFAGAGVLVGGRITLEDAYAYAKFARVALHTDDVDFRSREHSAEEAAFLAARVAGMPVAVSYRDLERAPVVVLAGFEPEEESPIVFLRLRRAVRKDGLVVHAVAPYATRGLEKLAGELVATVPGAEAAALDSLAAGEVGEQLRRPGAVILVGERLAGAAGALSSAVRLADATGAVLAWVPRRAGERGAVEAGALPGLLPRGRPLADDRARREVETLWGVDRLPDTTGLDTSGILAAATRGDLGALLVGGVELDDLADPRGALAALEAVGCTVSLELRSSAVTERADVVFPVAAVAEKSGTYLNWEGRERSFGTALRGVGTMPDLRVLGAIAQRMGSPLGLADAAAARAELHELGTWGGDRAPDPDVHAAGRDDRTAGDFTLATWRMLIDRGRMLDDEPSLAATARTPVARLSPASAGDLGLSDGDPVTVSSPYGSITLPLLRTDMPDGVVWLPAKSPGSEVYRQLAVTAGDPVRVHAADRAAADGGTREVTA